MKKIFITSIIALALILGLAAIFSGEKAEASVPVGNGYAFKVATTSQASATVPFVVRGGSGIFGSIVIASTTDVRIKIYDSLIATSTTAATSTLIADFAPNTPAGTYTFDVNVTRGIAVDLPATYKGVVTFTYR
jgi:ABC-type glycerol-3-phosphate transport system substrate-binding protein